MLCCSGTTGSMLWGQDPPGTWDSHQGMVCQAWFDGDIVLQLFHTHLPRQAQRPRTLSLEILPRRQPPLPAPPRAHLGAWYCRRYPVLGRGQPPKHGQLWQSLPAPQPEKHFIFLSSPPVLSSGCGLLPAHPQRGVCSRRVRAERFSTRFK